MDARSESGTTAVKNPTKVKRQSDRELVVSRVINGPARIVFEAWTKPELMQKWWVPKSAPITLLACEMDVRVGGGYRLVFSAQGSEMAFFGTYREVTPCSRLVWSNEEGGEEQITTVTFEEKGGKTLVVLRELYPTKEALDEALATGSSAWGGETEDGQLETFDQLEELVIAQVASAS